MFNPFKTQYKIDSEFFGAEWERYHVYRRGYFSAYTWEWESSHPTLDEAIQSVNSSKQPRRKTVWRG